MASMKTKSHEITDPQALYEAHPHLFTYAPDHTKIRNALKAGFSLPGVTKIDPNAEDEAHETAGGVQHSEEGAEREEENNPHQQTRFRGARGK